MTLLMDLTPGISEKKNRTRIFSGHGGGFFPETTAGLEDCRFALVSLDADLYAPTLAGLHFFYPRLNPGGVILLQDYNSRRFRGAAQAVKDFERASGPVALVPLCDLHGTAVIVRT